MLDGVLITDTFVLDWHRDADRLVFLVEASLHPGHPSYELPKAGEWTCYKRGRLIFDQVKSVYGLAETASVRQYTDPDGSRDFGSIDALSADADGFRISGDFGVVQVVADSVRLEVPQRQVPLRSAQEGQKAPLAMVRQRCFQLLDTPYHWHLNRLALKCQNHLKST